MAIGDVIATANDSGRIYEGSLSYNKKLNRLAVGADTYNDLYVYDLPNLDLILNIDVGSDTTAVDFSDDGRYVVTMNDYDNGLLIFVDIDSAEVIGSGRWDEDEYQRDVVWMKRQSYVAVCGYSGWVRVLDVPDGGVVRAYDVGGTAQALASSSDGTYLAVGGYNGLRVINIFTDETVFSASSGDVKRGQIEFIEEDRKIAVLVDNDIKIYSFPDGSLLSTHPVPGTAYSFSINNDGKYAIVGSSGDSHQAHLVNLQDDTILYSFGSHNDDINNVRFINNDNSVITSDYDGRIYHWDIVDKTGHLYFKNHEGTVLNSVGNGAVLNNFMGAIRHSEGSEILEMSFVNETGVSLENINITTNTEPTGIDLTFSKTEDPFDALQSLTYAGPIADDVETTFYIKIDSDGTDSMGVGEVGLDISADESV